MGAQGCCPLVSVAGRAALTYQEDEDQDLKGYEGREAGGGATFRPLDLDVLTDAGKKFLRPQVSLDPLSVPRPEWSTGPSGWVLVGVQGPSATPPKPFPLNRFQAWSRASA